MIVGLEVFKVHDHLVMINFQLGIMHLEWIQCWWHFFGVKFNMAWL